MPNKRFDRSAQELRSWVPSSLRSSAPGQPRRRDNVRAQLRVVAKRILRKYGYPPHKQEKAAQTVLEQAEVLSGAWAGA